MDHRLLKTRAGGGQRNNQNGARYQEANSHADHYKPVEIRRPVSGSLKVHKRNPSSNHWSKLIVTDTPSFVDFEV
jgi:hypothetical protein